jgi:uncharacterized protein (DUF488 family)
MKDGIKRLRLFTIGHSNLSLERFLALLAESSIRVVADVRSNPASSRSPWFERAALARELESRGLSYRWFRDLGGRRPRHPDDALHPALCHEWQRIYAAAMNRREFHRSCEDLLGLASSALVAVLCAERDPGRCHRSLLSDRLTVMGARVVHILGSDGENGLALLFYSGRQLSML